MRRRSKYFMDVGSYPVADDRTHDICKFFHYNNKSYAVGSRLKAEPLNNKQISIKTGLTITEIERIRRMHFQLMKMNELFFKRVIINAGLPKNIEATCFSILSYNKVGAVNYYLFSTLDKWLKPRYE